MLVLILLMLIFCQHIFNTLHSISLRAFCLAPAPLHSLQAFLIPISQFSTSLTSTAIPPPRRHHLAVQEKRVYEDAMVPPSVSPLPLDLLPFSPIPRTVTQGNGLPQFHKKRWLRETASGELYEMIEGYADDDYVRVSISELRNAVLHELKMHDSFVQSHLERRVKSSRGLQHERFCLVENGVSKFVKKCYGVIGGFEGPGNSVVMQNVCILGLSAGELNV
ncbi:hypothetical protein Drorol1_Dr00025659 [Drosera rotundifolia]